MNQTLFKTAGKEGLLLLLFYLILFFVTGYFHLVNLQITDTDFYIDTIKKLDKQDDEKLVTTPVYLIEITDADVARYGLEGYALPKRMIRQIVQKYAQSDARVLFMDLDIAQYGCIDSPLPTEADTALIRALNGLPKSVILPRLQDAPLYRELNNSSLAFLSTHYLADDDLSVTRYYTSVDGNETAVYRLYRLLSDRSDLNLEKSPFVMDRALSNLIIYKEFKAGNSYYSGLSKRSLSEFLDAGNSEFTDAVLLLGRTDSHARDFYNTPIGVLPGICIHANALMSMFYYGAIKSYLLLNLLVAFVLGFVFSIVFELLKAKTAFSAAREESVAAVGIAVFSVLCLFLSYLLLEHYSIWLDYQKVVFVFTLYEGFKLIKTIQIRKGKP